jgi:hypothetical protein
VAVVEPPRPTKAAHPADAFDEAVAPQASRVPDRRRHLRAARNQRSGSASAKSRLTKRPSASRSWWAPRTREVQATVRHAAKAEADAVFVLPNYYIKGSAEDVCGHFARVAETADIPSVAYSNTVRTGITLDVGILEQTARIPSVVALKECVRQLALVSAKIKAVSDRIANAAPLHAGWGDGRVNHTAA